MALKTMSVAQLQDLKSKIEAAISAKVTERRRELEAQLSKLSGLEAAAERPPSSVEAVPRGMSHLNTATPRTPLRPGLAAVSSLAGSRLRSRAARNLRILLSLLARRHQKQMAAKRPVARPRKLRAPKPTCAQFATFRPRLRTIDERTVTRRKRHRSLRRN